MSLPMMVGQLQNEVSNRDYLDLCCTFMLWWLMPPPPPLPWGQNPYGCLWHHTE